ncbi:unnamed protein product, partial [Laminaria digitata]
MVGNTSDRSYQIPDPRSLFHDLYHDLYQVDTVVVPLQCRYAPTNNTGTIAATGLPRTPPHWLLASLPGDFTGTIAATGTIEGTTTAFE